MPRLDAPPAVGVPLERRSSTLSASRRRVPDVERDACRRPVAIAVRYGGGDAARPRSRRRRGGGPLVAGGDDDAEAARRLTSHSNGRRQRLVEVVEVEHEAAIRRARRGRSSSRWASPQACTATPCAAWCERSAGHDRGATAVERERRDDHPRRGGTARARDARSSSWRLEDPDRVGTIGRGVQSACEPRGASTRAARPRAMRSDRNGTSVMVILTVNGRTATKALASPRAGDSGGGPLPRPSGRVDDRRDAALGKPCRRRRGLAAGRRHLESLALGRRAGGLAAVQTSCSPRTRSSA